jgi:hypothetical protein
MVAAEPTDDLAPPERLVQLANALFQQAPDRHRFLGTFSRCASVVAIYVLRDTTPSPRRKPLKEIQGAGEGWVDTTPIRKHHRRASRSTCAAT